MEDWLGFLSLESEINNHEEWTSNDSEGYKALMPLRILSCGIPRINYSIKFFIKTIKDNLSEL